VLWSRRSSSARTNQKAAFRSCAWLAQHPAHSLTALLLTPMKGTDQRAKFAAVSALLGVCDDLALLVLEPSPQALQHVSKQPLMKVVEVQKADEVLPADSVSASTSATARQQTCAQLVQVFVPALTSIATAGAARPTALTASAAECMLLLTQALCQQPYDSSTAAATSVALQNSILVLQVISNWYSETRTLYTAALQNLIDTITSNIAADNLQAAARYVSSSVQYIIGTAWPTAQLQKVTRTMSPAELLRQTVTKLIAEAMSSDDSNISAEEHALAVVIALSLALGEHDHTTMLAAMTTADASLLMQLHSAVVTCMRSSAAAVSLAVALLALVYVQCGVLTAVLSDEQAAQLLIQLLPLLSQHSTTAAVTALVILQHTAAVVLQRPELLLPLVLEQLQYRKGDSSATVAAIDRSDVLRLLAAVISELKRDAYCAAASSHSVLMQSITERVIDTLSGDTAAASADDDSALTAVLLQLEPTLAVTHLCSKLAAASSTTPAAATATAAAERALRTVLTHHADAAAAVSTFADCCRYADVAATWPATFTAQQLPQCAAALQATGALPGCLTAVARKVIAAPAESTPLAVFAALAATARSAQDAAAVLSVVVREMRSQSELTEAMLAEDGSSSVTASTATGSSSAAVATLLFARMSPLLLVRVLPVPALALALALSATTAGDAEESSDTAASTDATGATDDDDIAAELVAQLDRRLLRVYEYETVSKLAAEVLGRLPPHLTVPAGLARISAYTDTDSSSTSSTCSSSSSKSGSGSIELQALPSGLLVPASARASRSAVVLCAAAAVQPQSLHSSYVQQIAAVMVTVMAATTAAATDTTAAATALEKVQRGCIDCCARLLDSELAVSTATSTASAATAGMIGELCVTVGIRGESRSLFSALQQPSLQLRICLVNVLISAAKVYDAAKLRCLVELHGLLEACVTAGTASTSHTAEGELKAHYSEQQQQQLQAACLQAAFVLVLRGHSLYHYAERADALLLDLAAVVAAADASSRRSEVVRLGALKLLSAAVAALTVNTTAATTAAAAAVVVFDSTLQGVAAALIQLQQADESSELRSLAAVALQTLLQDKLAQQQQVQSFDADADDCE
jgi:hypothetical protein